MAADEDIELRDLLLETLEKRGVINRVKAELRANVYLALEEQEGSRLHGFSEQETSPGSQEKPGPAAWDEEGRLAASLVHDFLSASNLRFTLSVLEPEALIADPLSRQELSSRLSLEAERPGPLLLQLLQRSLPEPTQAPDANQAAADSVAPGEMKSAILPLEAPDGNTACLATAAAVVVPAATSRLPPLLSVPPNMDTPVHVEGEPHSLQSTASRRTEPSGSEESVEEELSHLDESSLSTTADDRTVDQTISRSSDLDGCDYAEAAAH